MAVFFFYSFFYFNIGKPTLEVTPFVEACFCSHTIRDVRYNKNLIPNITTTFMTIPFFADV